MLCIHCTEHVAIGLSRVLHTRFHEYLFYIYELCIMVLFKPKILQDFSHENFIVLNPQKFIPANISAFMVFNKSVC